MSRHRVSSWRLCIRLSEGAVWGGAWGIQSWFETTFGNTFRDFAGSIVVHAVGGFIALAAVLRLGPRLGRYGPDGPKAGFPPSSIPWLALGSWLLCVGWFGFNVMSAQSLEGVSGLVAMSTRLMAMVGGILAATTRRQERPGFRPQWRPCRPGCSLRRVRHHAFRPEAFVVGAAAGVIFVKGFQICPVPAASIDDVLGVWPLHGLCGLWGGIAAGIFGAEALGGLGDVSFVVQLVGIASRRRLRLRRRPDRLFDHRSHPRACVCRPEDEQRGADRAIHSISANPEADILR